MTRPSRFQILNYALEGVCTLIGTGDPSDEKRMDAWESDRIWLEKEILRVAAQPKQPLSSPTMPDIGTT